MLEFRQMLARRIAFILAVTIWFSGQIFASENYKISLDPWGNINTSWLSPSYQSQASDEVEGIIRNELRFSRSELSQPQTLYFFTLEATAFDIQSEIAKFYLVFSTEEPLIGSSIYLTYSRDDGQTFSQPQLISKGGKNPTLAMKNDLIWIAWEEEESIYLVKSEDGGDYFNLPESFHITGESLSSPSLLIDQNDNIHITFLSANPDIGLNRIMYSQLTPLPFGTTLNIAEPRVLFESYDNLINLRIKNLSNHTDRLIIFWQKEYLQRLQSYFALSLDSGTNFSSERSFEFESDLLDLGFIKDKFSAVSYTDRPVVQEIEMPLLAAPQLLSPVDGSILNKDSLGLTYSFSGSYPLLCKVELSNDNNFQSGNTLVFDHLVATPTGETIEFNFPIEIPDGNYFLRIFAFDGISASPYSQIQSFSVDNSPPEFISFEAERINKNINFKGDISELPAWLSINGVPISLELGTQFETQFQLEAGDNLFTFILSDECGNTLIVSEEVFYNTVFPEITVIAPDEEDWFRPESTIMIQADVFDLQGDIENESEARIMIDGILLENTLLYDREESSLFGFIPLPEGLTDGIHSGKIILNDMAGNIGEGNLIINIDGSPPQVTQQPGQQCFTDSQNHITLPLVDQGAGLDPSGTIITIAGISFEGIVSLEGDSLIVTSDSQLLEGTYEVEVIPRDLVGNIGEMTSFLLIVDTTLPILTLYGTYETQTNKDKLLIEGNVDEEYPASVTIYNNQIEVKNFSLNGNYFSVDVKLVNGNNDILIEAADQAGNKDSEGIRTFSLVQSRSNLIASFAHGPNPFSPVKELPGAFSTHGKGMVFAYTLAQPADIKIRIYDITGTLIWVKDIYNAGSGVTAWSGTNQFGQITSNGVYPYFFSVSADGATETRKGKIIISR